MYKGVEIHWSCHHELILSNEVPLSDVIHFPGGLRDYLDSKLDKNHIIGEEIFSGNAEIIAENIKVEWAVCWHERDNFIKSYCNTIPTPLGGTHEQGIRAALLRGIKIYRETGGHKKVSQVSPEDVLESACFMLSVL